MVVGEPLDYLIVFGEPLGFSASEVIKSAPKYILGVWDGDMHLVWHGVEAHFAQAVEGSLEIYCFHRSSHFRSSGVLYFSVELSVSIMPGAGFF